MTPADAMTQIEAMRTGLEAAISTEDPDAIINALEKVQAASDALQEGAADADDPENGEIWGPVGQAFEDLQAWLEAPAGEPAEKSEMTHDEKVKLAVAIATRGRSLRAGTTRRRDLGDVILEGFEAGAAGLVKLTYHTIRLTVLGIAAVARGVAAGVVHVAEHYRNGRRVAAYDRQPPAKSFYEVYG